MAKQLTKASAAYKALKVFKDLDASASQHDFLLAYY